MKNLNEDKSLHLKKIRKNTEIIENRNYVMKNKKTFIELNPCENQDELIKENSEKLSYEKNIENNGN